jgi:predicted ArsR family transcriptional regulator
MNRQHAETVGAIEELWRAETPATVRSVANALGVDDKETKRRLQDLVDNGTATMAPIRITVLAEGGTSAVADAYFLMVPDAVFDAEDALGSWRRET